MRKKRLRTVSTSRQSARATPVVLRRGDNIRLLFKPEIVENVKEPEAAVSGSFIYQKRRARVPWEDVDSINLSSLKAGEGVRLQLHSAEVLALYEHLTQLYTVADSQGVRRGIRDFIILPRNDLTDQVATLLDADTEPELLGAFLDWLKRQDSRRLSKVLGAAGIDQLMDFDAALGAARLRRVLDEMKANRSNANEGYWQKFFASNSWLLAQLFAHPVVIIRGQVYVGGKNFENQGGSLPDFLYRNKMTHNAMLVEIKTPTAELLSAKEYRNRVFGCSEDLVAATQQIALARQRLIQEGRQLASEDDPEYRILNPRGVLLIGRARSLRETARRRSFELFRNNLREIEVVCFDELFAKATQLLELIQT